MSIARALIPDSQGSAVAFDGVTLANVTSVSVDGGTVSTVDVTSMACRVVGSGFGMRAVLEEHPGNVSLGQVEVTFNGPQALTVADQGRFGMLVCNWRGQPINSFATLVKVQLTGQTNDIIRGSMTWKLTG